VRSLIADLGDAYCLELRRTAIGPFEVAAAMGPPPRGTSWPELPADPAVIPLERALELARQ
jgi:tRNA pseudouridine55 synthase